MRIYLRYALFTGLRDIALKDTSQNQTLLLLGHRSADGAWVNVVAAVRVKAQDGELSETVWRAARQIASERYPDYGVVGWYRSHPNSGVAPTVKELGIHKRFFPEKWQVFYTSDPVMNERRFYAWRADKLAQAGGFRIYGKEEVAKKMSDREPTRQDNHLHERYLERSVEKMQKMLQTPTVRNIDYVIIGLLVLVLGLVLLRPQPTAKVDDALQQKVDQMASEITELNQKVGKLQTHLSDMNAIDTELKLPGSININKNSSASADSTVKADTTTSKSEASASRSSASKSSSQRKVDGVEVGSKVQVHKVVEGDTLYSICEEYYGSATTAMAEALSAYNKVSPEELYVGDELKIPAKSALGVE